MMARTYNPPHEVREPGKLASMVETLMSGGELPPIIVCGEQALSGSHRLAAWSACDMEPDVIEIDESDLACAMAQCGLDPMYDEIDDYSELCRWLHDAATDDDVLAALEDQR